MATTGPSRAHARLRPATSAILMILPRRVLVVHAEARARRRLLLVLVESGYDVRGFATVEAALNAARMEWFDLALVDYALPGGEGFGFTRTLRQVQPTLPVVMLLPSLELPLIIEGIRLGLTDVLPAEEDPRPVLRRVNALLRPGTATTADDLTPDELAEVDETLAKFSPAAPDPADAAPDPTATLRDELAAAIQARRELETQLEQALREKSALAAELQLVVQQAAEAAQVQAEAAQLQSEKEWIDAAKSSIEAKSRQLAEMREQIAAERLALEEARQSTTPTRPQGLSEETFKLERAHLAALREDLREDEKRLREEWTRVRQEAAAIAQERRRWHEELDQLREREDNLRSYEQRLRTMQAQIENERVNRPASTADGGSANQIDRAEQEALLRAEWEKVHRAKQVIEAEAALHRDERMTLQELEKQIRQREERLRQLDQQIAAHEVSGAKLGPSGGDEPRGRRGAFGLFGKNSG